ncbi:hypothetical protein FACS1894214_2170 [Planctomycetales bacterium]|nr:hypothetical protein FACS1894214_2170 [Planctomycetales bacterium]
MAGQIVAGSVVVNLVADNQKFNAALNRTSVTVNNFGNRMQGVFDRVSSTLINFAAARTAFAGIPSAFSQVFSVFSGFESQLSKVQAVSGATAKQMGELREQAKLLGRTTFFTASQVGNAQQMLAQSGYPQVRQHRLLYPPPAIFQGVVIRCRQANRRVRSNDGFWENPVLKTA